MKSNNITRQIVSFLLVMVFALSITPKKTLHTWLAQHTDQAPSAKKSTLPHVGIAGFQCNVDNNVAESPFDNLFSVVLIPALAQYTSYNEGTATSFFTRHHFYCELRGPPFIV